MYQIASRPTSVLADAKERDRFFKRTNTLREINVNSMIVNQNTLHLEICLLAVLLIFVLDECIL